MRSECTALASGEVETSEDFTCRHDDTAVFLQERDGHKWLAIESYWQEGDAPDAAMTIRLSQEQINGMARWLSNRSVDG
jgi:hypothetical protein